MRWFRRKDAKTNKRLKKIETSLERLHEVALATLNLEVMQMFLSDEVKAKMAEINTAIQSAVADILALHAKVDNLLQAGNIEEARAALTSVDESLVALKAAVDIPEDPAPVEPTV